MDKNEVLTLMKSSESKEQWNANCDRVKAMHNGSYPDYWYQEAILSGLIDDVLGKGSSKITIR